MATAQRATDPFLRAFGVPVVFGTASARGIVSTREALEPMDGLSVRRRQRVVRVATGALGTVAVGDTLTVDGTAHRVDDIDPIGPDAVFTEYVLAGGA